MSETYETWTCECKPSREWHSPRHCGHGRAVQVPVPPLYHRAPISKARPAPTALGGVVEPSRPAADADWPRTARQLRAATLLATVARGTPLVDRYGRPVRTLTEVTSLRLVGADWWAVWENGLYHCGFVRGEPAGLRVLVAYVRGA